MKNVYFKKIENFEEEEINNAVYEMLKTVESKESIILKGTVPLKVHFGEMGNDTFIRPEYFNGIKRYLKEKNLPTCYMDTNALYKGSRTKEEDHIKTAIAHGFTDLEVIIADGDEENPYVEVEINGDYFKKCKIGTKYKDYNNYIILAHFKGHGMAGMGASIKQLAMGFASRAGKLAQHADSIPTFNEDICISCGACVNKCPVNAIKLDPKAVVDNKVCIGCASCSAVCPVEAIANAWETPKFHEKLAEYALAAAKGKNNIYINYAFNITKECDCYGIHMDLITKNIGVFISTDPVSIDKATLDKFVEETGIMDFNDVLITLKHGAKIGLGNLEYNLIEL